MVCGCGNVAKRDAGWKCIRFISQGIAHSLGRRIGEEFREQPTRSNTSERVSQPTFFVFVGQREIYLCNFVKKNIYIHINKNTPLDGLLDGFRWILLFVVFVIRNSCRGIFHRGCCNGRWMASGIRKGGGRRGGEKERGGREIRIKEDIAIDRVKLKMKRDFFEFQKFINAFWKICNLSNDLVEYFESRNI